MTIAIAFATIFFYSCNKNNEEIKKQATKIEATTNEVQSSLSSQPIIAIVNTNNPPTSVTTGTEPTPPDCVKSTINNKLISTTAQGSSDFITTGNNEMYNFRDNFKPDSKRSKLYNQLL